MYRSLALGLSLTAAALMTGHAEAAKSHNTQFDKPIVATVTMTGHSLKASAGAMKKVYLMNMKLTAKQRQHFLHYTSKHSHKFDAITDKLPAKVDLGMNGVPVLDQGNHGTCVTFANTGALDALLGQGDYISQYANLELGSYLQDDGYVMSGWDGSFGEIVLDQIEEFGFVPKNGEDDGYPLDDPYNTGTPMSLDDFHSQSYSLDNIYWDPMLTPYERFTQWDVSEDDEGAKLLANVKETLATRLDDGDVRLTFGVLIPVNHCDAGACGSTHAKNDTWVVTNAIKYDEEPMLGGHEMIITGYDDKAITVDNEGNKQKGVLILRNSWGENTGDYGTYYMTYDYFQQYVIEVSKIVRFNSY